MKLKKFFKPLVTVSALSMLLMGCAEDSSNGNGGSSTTTPTAQSVFTNFLAGFQSAPAKNDVALEFTTKTTDKKPLSVAKDAEAVKYLVSLDNVMATYYATFGITGTSTLLTGEGSDLSSSSLSKITHYAKVDKGSDTTEVQLELKNGTNSLYTGMFALMTADEVKELDTALADLQTEIDKSKGEGETPVPANIDVAAVQKVVDLINGNMYKVAYNSPAQSVEAAFAKAQTLTLAEGNSMKFTEGNSQEYKIATSELSFAGATPAVVEEASVVVFLDEFKNVLNGVADGETDKNTVKGKTDLTTNQNLKITTNTLSSSANSGEITYTPAAEPEAGKKETYIAIVDSTTNIDSADSKLGALNKVIANGANKEQVEAALAELGTIYKVEYSVDTIANLIETFKASEAVKAALENPTPLESLTYENQSVDYDATKYLYCLYEANSIKLSTFGGKDVSTDVITNYVNGGKGQESGSSPTKKIIFEEKDITYNGTYYAYCTTVLSEELSLTSTTIYEKLVEFFNTLQAQPDGTSMQVFAHEKTDGTEAGQ